MRLSIARAAAVAASLFGAASSGTAQNFPTASPSLAGDADERARLAQLDGAATDGFLLRSSSWRLPQPSGATAVWWALLGGELAWTHNSTLPFPLNDGAMWAGRGGNLLARAGVLAQWRRVRVVIAPELTWSANRFVAPPDTDFVPPPEPGRGAFANPWHTRPYGIDLPLRPGNAAVSLLTAGQSSLTVFGDRMAFGIAHENGWWGPGLENALILSNHAGGFPHLFLRTARPLVTRAGLFEAVLFAGGLSESGWFDSLPGNDLRSLSAAAVTWRASPEAGLSLGLARAVFRPARSWGSVPLHVLDVVTSWRRPNDRAPADSAVRPGPDQLFSVFGRWVFPANAFELYGEWGRSELPKSPRDFLVAPSHSRAWTLGFQWAGVRRGASRLRLLGEATTVERAPSIRDRATHSWYTSRAVVQGYTQRGQTLGAAIGPGGSSQSFAADWFAPMWRAGVFGSRIRWDNDAWADLSFTPPENEWCSHDVTTRFGVRGGVRSTWGTLLLSVASERRLNRYYQNRVDCYIQWNGGGLRERNTTLSVTLSPGR